VVVSVSIDTDVQVLRDTVARRQFNWPQICDGKGADTEIARLYNAGASTFYVVDRDGKIAGTLRTAKGLEKIERLVEKLVSTP
jgi:hypothetical protein